MFLEKISLSPDPREFLDIVKDPDSLSLSFSLSLSLSLSLFLSLTTKNLHKVFILSRNLSYSLTYVDVLNLVSEDFFLTDF